MRTLGARAMRSGLLATTMIGLGSGRPPALSAQNTTQLSAEVYARAERLLGPNLAPLVRNVFVVPHWVGRTDEFWYDRQLEDGHQFVLVDAATGSKVPAFDHAALAAALSAASGHHHSATTLPFDRFAYTGSREGITFVVSDDEYTCGLVDSTCRRRPVPAEPPGVLVSPDARWGVLTRDGNLWLRDLTGGGERALTTDGEINFGYGIYPDNRADYVPVRRAGQPRRPTDSQWAPDATKVIVPLIDQRHVEPYPFVESIREDGAFRPIAHPVRIPLVGERPATFEWYVFDIPRGARRKLELPSDKLLLIQQDILAIRDTWWSEDGNRLFAVAHGDNMESAYLFDIDLRTGAVRTVVEERLLPRMDLNSTSYNPVNVRVINDGADVIWFSQRTGWGHLYRYDGQTGRLANPITAGEWLVRDIIEVDEDRGIIYFTGSGREGGNPYYRYLYRVNLDGSGLTLLSPETADHLLLPNKEWVLSGDGIVPYSIVSPSGRYVVYNYSRVDQPTKFVIRSTRDAKLVATVEEADARRLRAAGWRPPAEFVAKAADGTTDLYGVIYRPSDFNPTTRYPILDAQYASPLMAVTPRHFYQAYRGRQPVAPSSYAELGFVVISVDARGTTYRSREFLHASYGKLHTIGLEDHVAVMRQLAERYRYIDIDRAGIYGHSYGGYTVVRAMLEFPAFFKVGISSAGPAVMQGMYLDYHWTAFHGRPRYSDGSEWRPHPTEVPANYVNVDARQQAKKLQGKLLIQFGDLDENVPPGAIFPFIDALIAENKDFDMLYLPNRNHQFIGEGYVMRRDWDYMVRHLLGREPPKGYRIEVQGR